MGLRKKLNIWILTSLAVALLVVGFTLTSVLDCPYQRNGSAGEFSVQIVQANTLLPVAPTFYNPLLSRDLFRVVACENRNWDIFAKNPSSTAYGLCQIIDGTWSYLEDKWAMKLNRDDPNDQLYACQRLLTEENIYPHWEAIKECLNKWEIDLY